MAFTPNYKTKALNSDETYAHKKHYDSNIYVVLTNNNFSIKVGNTLPSFICYLKQLGEQFGDPLPAEISETARIIFRVYDMSGGIQINSEMTQTDAYLGEWKYEFSTLDFTKVGRYAGEIIIFENNIENLIGKFNINAT